MNRCKNRKTHDFYYVIALIVILLLNLLLFPRDFSSQK